MLRTARAGSESLADEIHKTVWAVKASVPVTEMRTMGEIYQRSMARTSFMLTMLARLFAGHGLFWGAIGAGVGLAAAAVLSRLATAAVASYLPARRVTRVDPMEALRAD